jgi:hypothetical protein
LRQREIRIEPECQVEFGQRVVEAARKQINAGQCMVRPKVLSVGSNGCQCCALGDRCRPGYVFPAHMRAERMTGSKNSERLAVIRIDTNGLFQQSLRHYVVLSGHPPVMRQRSHHQIPGIHAVWRFAPGVKILGGIELRLDGGDDGLGDLILPGENVGKGAIVSFRPDVAAGGDVIELRSNADTVAALAHASLDYVTDT